MDLRVPAWKAWHEITTGKFTSRSSVLIYAKDYSFFKYRNLFDLNVVLWAKADSPIEDPIAEIKFMS